MPLHIDTITEIGVREKRDVLFAAFKSKGPFSRKRNWRASRTRKQAIKFLEKLSIEWAPCFGLEADCYIIYPYEGQVFIDVNIDDNDPGYQKVCSLFEHPNGTPRFASFHLYIVPYELSLKARDISEA